MKLDLPSNHKSLVRDKIRLTFFAKRIHPLTRTINVIALIIILLEIIGNLFYLISVNLDDPHRPISTIWFKYLQFFTYQSNIFVLIVFIQYFSQLHIKERKYWTNSYMLYAMTYIFITFLTYACFLSWTHDEFGITHYRNGKIDYVWYVQNIILHFVCPTLCLSWFILSCFAPSYFHYQMYSMKWWKFIMLGLIYPIIYLIYADLLSTITFYAYGRGGQKIVYPVFTIFVGDKANILVSSLVPIIGLIIFVIFLFSFWIIDRYVLDKKTINHNPITLINKKRGKK